MESGIFGFNPALGVEKLNTCSVSRYHDDFEKSWNIGFSLGDPCGHMHHKFHWNNHVIARNTTQDLL